MKAHLLSHSSALSIRKLYEYPVTYQTRALWPRFRRTSMILLVVFGSGFGSLAVGPVTSVACSSAHVGGQELSSGAQTWLRTTITQGKFAELRWPDFSDYRRYVDDFYELNSLNMERIRAAMNGDKPLQVSLTHPIPLFIVYGTAIVTEDRVVHFYDDIYGHDTMLEKALAKGYPYPW